jgi:hypothetical protein
MRKIYHGYGSPAHLSFVHLEASYPFASYPDTIEVIDGQVVIYNDFGNTHIDSVVFVYTHFDSTFFRAEYRHADFSPTAGQAYELSCFKEGYPRLTGRTTVPCSPVLVDGSIELSDHRFRFTILRDSLAVLYDVYFWDGISSHFQRLRRSEVGNTSVEFNVQEDHGSEGNVLIYAYDAMLSEYIAYNVNVKPNTYRSDYSNVENGYGCFGSLNFIEKTVSF